MTTPSQTSPATDGTLDVVVIGSGPGGYVAAIRAAQLGLRVACVERAELGGICLNWGCIPTKALLRSAEVLALFHRAKEFGLAADSIRVDFPAIIQRSRDIAAKISKGVQFLFKKNKIEHVAGKRMTLTMSCDHRVIDGALGARFLAVLVEQLEQPESLAL